jgi:hypothetical protein
LRNFKAALLAEARRRSGFASAAAAATAYGWSDVTLRAHERGARKISSIDAEKYALAFGLPVASLEDTEKAERELERLRREPAPMPSAVRSDGSAGRRLRIVRLIRGFESVRAAADHFGFVQPTVVAHESGTNPVTRRSALGYAAAYGVSPEWLLRGLAASGLGPLVDASLASADDWENLDIRELRKLADVDGEKDTMGLRRLLRERQWAGVAESDGDNIPELSARQLELGAEFNFEASKFWKLPTGVATSLLESEAGALVVLPLELSQGRFSGGDRLFIDITKRDLRSNGTFAYIVNGTLRVVDASFDLSPYDPALLLGQVVGVFARLSGAPYR